MTVEAFPLHWPAGRPRTEPHWREHARFDTSMARARDAVVLEIERLTGTRRYGDANIVISTNVELRQDGLPYANRRAPADTGVAVYFTHRGRQLCFACDRWIRIEDNMQAIAKTIEALRGIERWGTGDMLEAAFTGFVALPAPGAEKHWRDVLGPCLTIDDARAAYRRAAAVAHPDRGGSDTQMAELNRAWEQAQQALR